MSDSAAETNPVASRVTIGVFVVLCAVIFTFLWTNSGGRVPVASSAGYEVTVEFPGVSNTVYFSDVMMAGVKVGKVRGLEVEGDRAVATLELDEDVAPLHDGATFTVRAKSLVEESYIEIDDAGEKEVADGGTFDTSSVVPAVQLDDVLNSLDEKTRADVSALLQSTGLATDGTQDEVAAALEGIGNLGREGEDVMSALAAQSADLQQLTVQANEVLTAMANQRTHLSSLTTSAASLLEVTSGQSADVEAVIAAMPPLLGSAAEATDDLSTLATSLAPVAANLEAAAPDLSTALQQLPGVTSSLRGLLPDLDSVLTSAPATLDQVPQLSTQVTELIPPTSVLLADANPVLGYLEPYGQDVAAWFTNFAQTVATGDENGRAFRVMVVLNEQSFKGIPLSTNLGPLDKFNALPLPGTGTEPGPARQDYPRVEREPVPQ